MIGRVMMVIVSLTVMGLLCVWQHLRTRTLQYRITSVRKELNEASRQQKRMRVELEKLRSPERLQSLRDRIQANFDEVSSRKRTLTLTEMRDLLEKQRAYASLQETNGTSDGSEP